MKKSWTAICGVSALGVALAASAAALQNDGGWFQQRACALFVHRVERQLDITDAQRDQIATILKTEKPVIQSLAATVHLEQEQLLSRQSFDEAYVRAYAQQHESTMEDVLVEREKVRTEILAVLTPDQRAKARQLRQTIYSHFSDRLAELGDDL